MFVKQQRIRAGLTNIEWLDPESIAAQMNHVAIKERDREHALKTGDRLQPFQRIELRNNFGIAACGEANALALEFLAQFAVVENLAVEQNGNSARAVIDGLVTSPRIDDRQPNHPRREPLAMERADAIWTTMSHGTDHSVRNACVRDTNDACDTAHKVVSPTTSLLMSYWSRADFNTIFRSRSP